MASDKPKRHYNLTPAGQRKLRRAIRRTKPWKRSTGPRTEAGKLRSAANAIYTFDHVKNPFIITDKNTAFILLAFAVIRYQNALLDAYLYGSHRWIGYALEMGKWSRRLVELGDLDNGFGRSILDKVTAWRDEVERAAEHADDLEGQNAVQRPCNP